MNRKGFTIAEIIITLTLITLVVGPLVNAYMVSMKSSEMTEKDFTMDVLAQELLEEILSKDYEDKDNYGHIGKETGEDTRKDFDDVDDYLGFHEDYGEIADINGTVIQRFSGYSRKVELYNEDNALLSSADGLSFEYERSDTMQNDISGIRVSRDGNRIFGIDRDSNSLFVANPFSDSIEVVLALDHVPVSMDVSPDSVNVYVNYGNRLEVYTYRPGELVLTNVVGGVEYGQIKDLDIIDGVLAVGTENGFFVEGENLNSDSDTEFLYSRLDKTVVASSDKVYIYNSSDLENELTSHSVPGGGHPTSAYYDEFDDKIYIAYYDQYVFEYDISADSWQHVVNNKVRYLNTLQYSYIDGEFYYGGDKDNSEGFFRTTTGDMIYGEPVEANSEKVIDSFYHEKTNRIYIVSDRLLEYDVKDRTLDNLSWVNSDGTDCIRMLQDGDNIYILTGKAIYRYDIPSDSIVGVLEWEGLKDITVDNQKLYTTDGSGIFRVSKDLTDVMTDNVFKDVDKIMCSKDGKLLYMLSQSNDKLYFFDTFTNQIWSADSDMHDFAQSSSGNIVMGPDASSIVFMKNTVSETNSTSVRYDDVINIDKKDHLLAFSGGDQNIQIFSYQDEFIDEFKVLSGYNYQGYFTAGDKGFNSGVSGDKLSIDTKSAIDSDENSNICDILFYRTFVFPIPKYLRKLKVQADFDFDGSALEFFCYSGALSR
ncbi:MAG: hypothetical protein ACOCWO_05205, partial [Candidatus Muiribacteriaceae bacterium]